MRALLFEETAGSEPLRFQASPLRGEDLGDEKRIQKLVFEHPELIPIEEIDPGARQIAPFCRELTLQGSGGPVYLDMLGVTRRGRLVLVECKLWRNPQARREVIGQILEYAALMRRLTYPNLSAMVQRRLRLPSSADTPNLLWSLAKDRLGLTDEAAFVDSVSQSLADGAFDLIVLGDGIRSELEAVRGYLEAAVGLRSRLTLVEVTAFTDEARRTLLVPKVALRTRLVEHRTISVSGGEVQSTVMGLDEDKDGGRTGASSTSSSAPPSPEQAALRAENRAFWQPFIEEVSFSNPEQPKPSHGGNNWVRIPLPLRPLVAFRATGPAGPNTQLGFFLRFPGEDPGGAYEAIRAQLPEIEAEIGASLSAIWVENRSAHDINLAAPEEIGADPQAQLAWLNRMADPLVNALRPRLAQLADRG